MAIKLQTMECKNTDLADFGEIKKEILAAAKRAKVRGVVEKSISFVPSKREKAPKVSARALAINISFLSGEARPLELLLCFVCLVIVL